MTTHTPELTPARLDITAQGDPFATEFGDCYFSRAGGLAETRYVFLEGNHLPQRWQQQEPFTILETGFGTGLNFLATWYEWQQDPKRCQTLHYIAIEKHPIPKATLAALLHWEELRPLAVELLKAYPPLIKGLHALILAQGRVRLSLYFDDIADTLTELNTKVDAFYLDGFAPDRNEAMWSPTVLQRLAQWAKPHATLATFTAAGAVRRHLQAASFNVVKRKGFGTKREMITASIATPATANATQPWFERSNTAYANKTATIIGAGLAGCQIAYALALRGWQVTVLERHAAIACEASGNPAGIVSPKMTAHWSWGEAFYRQAFIFATQQLNGLASELGQDWQPCGVLQLNHDTRELERWQSIQNRALDKQFIQLLNREEASTIAGTSLPSGGSYFPEGGYLKPSTLCRVLLNHPNITLHTHTEALELQYCQPYWQISSAQRVVSESATVVLTNGRDIPRFLPNQHFPLQAVWGQTSRAQATEQSQRLQCVLGHEGYITPSFNGEHIFGATFERESVQSRVTIAADNSNWQQLNEQLPTLAQELKPYTSGHAAMRMSTPDRFPYVGAIPSLDFYREAYSDLQHGRHWQTYPPAHYQTGLYVLTGLSARGLTTSALSAEVLAADMNQDPIPLQNTLQHSLHSARFIIRALKRGQTI
ncbi:bifunctional tRNA (5-methylaminomethyl-2-thiouridine)(34)-methyltransferase MnmD/FAD-dependent 5-carboxymethylaminomethyl-2-thiouridine(34) oxidoreductase MnmC [Thiofilum flexile]|uniref:bifunctional tRNA (5-methylaminomethyl-2-thiouridine)(34)-methyltransferase MnmD/FAD-dependent 5-carboxymethylaminomethyl-2-thiouridine(34) oxidoreductase MnmC n=1 Tax=Thiofilum flexile TaxID=125627 RepID=UPI000362A5F2|nr:bifunctional tRNA (5-methylaminomethyl-2-thiouridine)(34)-methyltransferase MnmD/FAD-dependent 5-carboxymethylaminomethyl-2-thiouridine(34) oxidoreductase MnmC [Thiofilum flexile]